MRIRSITLAFVFVMITGMLLTSCNHDDRNNQNDRNITDNNNMSNMMPDNNHMPDNRVSLNLSPKKARHQLMNMRNHLEAVQSIIFYLSKNNFDSASAVASSKLGLSKEMKIMCSSFGNEDFEKLGFKFHKSADRMSEVIKTKDKDKSLAALSVTLNYCVACHSAFKQ